MNNWADPWHNAFGGHAGVESLVAGITGYVRQRADALANMEHAIAAADSKALPRLAKAWILQTSGDGRFAAEISALITEAECRLPDSPGRTGQLLSALKMTRAGRSTDAIAALEAMLIEAPTDLFVHQLVHEALFWHGQPQRMRAVIEQSASAWAEQSDDYSAFLSMRSFANEEAGYLKDAERFGRQAVEIDPTDIWGAHAIAHVLIMTGRIAQGIDWLEDLSGNWGHANQMRHHLWWHQCLFLLELDQHQQVLDILSTHVRNPDSPLVRESPAAPIDITNVASLLMRLELRGVEVDEHWHSLASVCAGRTSNHGSAFANAHDVMVLSATGQFDRATELLENMRSNGDRMSPADDTAFRDVAVPLGQAIVAHRNADWSRALQLLADVGDDLHRLGASHAQRDVFHQLFFDTAKRLKRHDLEARCLAWVSRAGFHDPVGRAAYRAG